MPAPLTHKLCVLPAALPRSGPFPPHGLTGSRSSLAYPSPPPHGPDARRVNQRTGQEL